jgi:Putative MetA-pathway of phenol degradation
MLNLMRSTPRWVAVVLLLVLGVAPKASAQLVLPFVPELDDIPINAFSYAGFVDGAVPMSQMRLRVEGAYDSNRPSRAEYIMAGDGAKQRGLPLPERRVDYQEIHSYGEYAFTDYFSLFLDTPVRFLDPTVNLNHTGVGDLQAGLKYAFVQQGPLVATAQIRAYIPTGEEKNGLGTGHPSVEPALLFLWQESPTWRVEGEVQAWVPINDTYYGGEVVHYGLATSYGERQAEGLWFTPVVEAEGWYVVRGRETDVVSDPTTVIVRGRRTIVPAKVLILESGRENIVNGDIGVRAGWGYRGDIYVGYSRALTGEVWYKDMFRVELRYYY